MVPHETIFWHNQYMANPIGRPRIFKSPEDFDNLVDSYVSMCKGAEPKEPITLTGLCLALGFCSKGTLFEYQNYPEFSESVKRARLLVENEYEKRLGANNPTGSIFALKNMEWSDKLDLNHGGQKDNPVQVIDATVLSDSALNELMAARAAATKAQ